MSAERHPKIRGERTCLRPASEDDLDLLTGWHADPDVYEWWDHRALSSDEVAEKYVGRRSPGVESFIVEADGRSIGFLQYWLGDPGQAGLDMFLVPDARHRGLGPDAARAVVRYLIDERGMGRVTVDPRVDNARAIRAWRKVGFVEEKEFDGEDGRALLMVIEADR